MKVPLNWLRDYVELPDSVAQLAERLTLAGLEVAGVRVIGLPIPEGLRVKQEDAGPVWPRDKIIIGKVLSVERHPNADRLTLVTIDYGAAEAKKVVTGAPNLKVGDNGQKVILALTGSVLFDGHAEQKLLKELKLSKIRGVPSDAMVCSAYELGISEEHEGIILLEDEAVVGMPLVDYMGDIVFEIDVTPNLARCLSLIGVAREVAALMGRSLRIQAQARIDSGHKGEDPARVVIDDPRLCARYTALVLRGVHIGPSPGWMQHRLLYAGMRPINNIVDITNYVMLEWGQPLHAFDFDALLRRSNNREPVITVRSARRGEVLTTLDNQHRELSPDQLVIADSAGPIALAGVMGGAETEVSSQSQNILLESANFDWRSIRSTMKAFNLPSEASIRFSKGIHPDTAKVAAERAAELMGRHAGATVSGGMVDNYPAPIPSQVITLELGEVRRLLGMDFDLGEAARILRALEFQVEQIGPETMRVTTPPYRLDIQAGSADLIEDLARIHGYDRLPATLLAEQLPEQHANPGLALEEKTRDILTGAGLQEAITYALTEPAREAPLESTATEYVRLLNPISSERIVMRHTLLAGLLEVLAANLRHTDAVRVFEIGPVYLPQPGEKLPREPRRLALALTGPRQSEFWGTPPGTQSAALDFFDLKGVIGGLADDLHLPTVGYRSAAPSFLHPGKAAELVVQGHGVGHFGVLHPRAATAYQLDERVVLVGEFDLEAILAAVPARVLYSPIPRFPPALRDIAVIVEESIPAERVQAELKAAGGTILRGIRLFDVYRGDSIPAGTKSLAYALTYQAEDRTLVDKEVDKAHKKIEDRLKHVLHAQIRGQEAAE